MNTDAAAIARLERMGGQQLVTRIIELFFEHVPERVGGIRRAAATRELEQVRRGAHALKSTAATLGLSDLSMVSTDLERAAELGEDDVVARLAEELDPLLSASEQYLKQIVSQTYAGC